MDLYRISVGQEGGFGYTFLRVRYKTLVALERLPKTLWDQVRLLVIVTPKSVSVSTCSILELPISNEVELLSENTTCFQIAALNAPRTL